MQHLQHTHEVVEIRRIENYMTMTVQLVIFFLRRSTPREPAQAKAGLCYSVIDCDCRKSWTRVKV